MQLSARLVNAVSGRWENRESVVKARELKKRPFSLYCHNSAGALPVRVSLWTILNRTTQSQTGAASSGQWDGRRNKNDRNRTENYDKT